MGYQAHLPDLALGQRWAKGYYAQALNQTVLSALLFLVRVSSCSHFDLSTGKLPAIIRAASLVVFTRYFQLDARCIHAHAYMLAQWTISVEPCGG